MMIESELLPTIVRWLPAAIGRAHRFGAVTVMTAALVSVGCGDDSSDAQPVPNATAFEQEMFDDLPVYPRSDPISERADENGVVSRSYRAVGVVPQTIIDYYDAQLSAEGWNRSAAAPQSGFVRRGDWIKDDHRVEVSAQPIDDTQNPTSEDYAVQYNIVLYPR
jgi:hypothetical protein